MSCCDTSAPAAAKTSHSGLTVALAGNPNSGKTTVFNALTGLRQKVANYPGVTVERKTGRCKLTDGRWADIIDLPGTYSLISRSPDEVVAMEVLRGLRTDTPAPDVVVVVVDASNLQRNLYLVSQIIELGRPMVIALNMMDVAERRGLTVSVEALRQELGVPVIPIVGHKRKGIAMLVDAIAHAAVPPMPDWPMPDAVREELLLVGGGLAILDDPDHPDHPDHPRSPAPLPPVDHRPPAERTRLDHYQALAERLLVGDRAEDLDRLARQEPVASLLASAHERLRVLGIDAMHAEIESHYHWIDAVATRVVSGAAVPAGEQAKATWSERIDRIFIHKFWGLIVFAAIMGGLFVSIFWLARPIMDAIHFGIDWIGAAATAHMAEGPLRALLRDGIFAGVGAVVTFVPQIAILFLFLSILEDSGYLARAAFLIDRLLAKVGLHGKSFIPLLSSFACAIPGIMATRTIENRKDRLATILIAPFMSCSARLPVYTLLIGAFFVSWGAMAQAGLMLSLYLLGIVAAATVAWLMRRSLLRGPVPAFILEMPSYKVPQTSQVLRQMWTNTREFLTRAGTTIFCLSVLLWAMVYYPRLPADREESLRAGFQPTQAISTAESPHGELDNYIAAEKLKYSFAGRLGRGMEPAIRPLGYDWKMGVGLVGAFAAREVFVSTMAIIYSTGDVEHGTADLAAAMRADRYPGPERRPVWTPLVALSLLVWFVLAMQCMSTVAVVRRETGGWRWPLFMLFYMNALAWIVSFSVYQIGHLLV